MSQTQKVSGVATKIISYGENNKAVKYHETVVLSFDPVQIILNSGGWRTVTTKLRMNQAMNQFGLGYSVHQKNYDWHVVNQRTGAVIPFQDGMILNREV